MSDDFNLALIKSTSAPVHALREPDWRLRRLQELVELGLQPADGDDQGVKFAFPYYSHRARLNEEFRLAVTGSSEQRNVLRRLARLNSRSSMLYQVFKIHDEWLVMRNMIEAMVIGGADRDSIASALGTNSDVVEVYEALFFDIRSRLDKSVLVVSHTMSDLYLNGAKADDTDQTWKAFSYENGARILAALWRQASSDKDFDDELEGIVKFQAKKKAMLAVVSRDVNNFTANDVVMNYVAIISVDDEVDPNTDQAVGARQLVDALRYSVASSADVPDTEIEARIGLSLERMKKLQADAGDHGRAAPSVFQAPKEDPDAKLRQIEAQKQRVARASAKLMGKTRRK